MRNHEYHLLDVFTDRAFTGNPLAVFPRAEGMTSDTMQAIANELNLSETVFVGEPIAPGRYPIRIFTPARELPFAGHPTVGTAHLLAELGMVKRDSPLTLEARIGPLVVRYEDDLAEFTTATPVEIRASTLDPPAAVQLLGLDTSEVVGEPVLASCGLPYHLIELGSLEALRRAQPSAHVWSEWITPSGYDQIYLYVTVGTNSDDNVIRARMFSSKGGGREDPATGSAASALAGHLAGSSGTTGVYRWEIHQGVEMGRPSQIFASADVDGSDWVIRIAGKAVVVGTGMLKSAPGKSDNAR
ncbi:PhzF family phenazine biosynthesis protein [Halomonas salipaludis]|uniref:Diaminopimelate epimerase n=1 Tax=Halomonas salipaludis TaxID=2032625 RepID=A0A2A2F187_9GAMM|nr:PhzF family phenazine biosynthesis protein [Halomonas salipaludis]PAU78407.1 diaminopimelate epimerase [Halomonas salipaludis]